MAEIVSKQVARANAGKMRPSDFGKVRVVYITSPDTVAWADGDIIASGVRLPTGTKFLTATVINCDAMGASVVADIGLRDWVTKVAVDQDGLAEDIDVATTGRKAASNGVYVTKGADTVTTVATELYMTLAGAAPTANKQICAEVYCIVPG